MATKQNGKKKSGTEDMNLKPEEIRSHAMDLMGGCDAFILFVKKGDDLYELGVIPEDKENRENSQIFAAKMADTVQRLCISAIGRGLGDAFKKGSKKAAKKQETEPTALANSALRGQAKKATTKKAAK